MSLRLIISLAAAAALLVTAICAVVIFQEELLKLFDQCKGYCTKVLNRSKEEYADFADV